MSADEREARIHDHAQSASVHAEQATVLADSGYPERSAAQAVAAQANLAAVQALALLRPRPQTKR